MHEDALKPVEQENYRISKKMKLISAYYSFAFFADIRYTYLKGRNDSRRKKDGR